MKPMEIRPIKGADLDAVVRVHILAFPKSALTKLGKEAIRRYYLWLLNGPHESLCIAAFEDIEMRGFCFAGVFREALTGFLKRNKSFLAWRVLTHPWLAANPLFLNRLNKARTIIFWRPGNDSPAIHVKKSFGILSIAVDPYSQGAGYGRQLMAEVEKVARERDFMNMHLSVAVDNNHAITFYEKLGWQKLPAQDGKWNGSMAKHLEEVR